MATIDTNTNNHGICDHIAEQKTPQEAESCA